MSAAVAFIVGLVVGCNLGVVVLALCRASADRGEGGAA
jgi:hypothetical protein